MISFESPWLFALLPLPLFIYFLVPKAKQQQAALRVPFFQQMAGYQQSFNKPSPTKKPALLILLLMWLALLTASAQPLWIGEAIRLPTEGRDVMLAIDLSESMRIEDMNINQQQTDRLTAVKAVVSQFIDKRKGDRLGMIVFGSQAYLQAPLSFDQKTLKRFLLESQIGFAGPSTAIGDAIGLAVKRLRKRPGDDHIVILLTDGANTAGNVEPLAAAEFAAKHGIKIYTIGIGAEEYIQPGFLGSSLGARRINPSMDLDEESLKKIAALTEASYYRAKNTDELATIYQAVNQLEPVAGEEKTYRPKQQLFHWPLGFALIASLLFALNTLLTNAFTFHKTSSKEAL